MTQSQYIQRFSAADRLLHWVQALAFLTCLLTGLGMFSQHYHETFTGMFGGFFYSMWIHKISGLVFAAAAVLHFLSEWRDNLTFGAEDARWLARMGGYLSRRPVHFELGKYNTGQKLFAVVIFAGAIVMVWTGWIMWFHEDYSVWAREWSYALHALSFVIMTFFFFIHFYLTTLGNPGCAGGMFYGDVLKRWAKEHSPRWYKKKTGMA